MLAAENGMLAVSAVLGEAPLAAVQPAVEAEPPVPAAGGLEEVPTDRAHRAQLRRRRLRASRAQGLRDLRVGFELGESCSGADAAPVDAARLDPGEVDKRLGLREPVTEQWHELGSTGERS